MATNGGLLEAQQVALRTCRPTAFRNVERLQWVVHGLPADREERQQCQAQPTLGRLRQVALRRHRQCPAEHARTAIMRRPLLDKFEGDVGRQAAWMTLYVEHAALSEPA